MDVLNISRISMCNRHRITTQHFPCSLKQKWHKHFAFIFPCQFQITFQTEMLANSINSIISFPWFKDSAKSEPAQSSSGVVESYHLPSEMTNSDPSALTDSKLKAYSSAYSPVDYEDYQYPAQPIDRSFDDKALRRDDHYGHHDHGYGHHDHGYGHHDHGYGHHHSYKKECCPLVVDPLTLAALLGALAAASFLLSQVIATTLRKKKRKRRSQIETGIERILDLAVSGKVVEEKFLEIKIFGMLCYCLTNLSTHFNIICQI